MNDHLATAPLTGSEAAPAADHPLESDHKLALAVEDLVVSKRSVVTGRVRVSTSVEHHEEVVRAMLESEHVEVVRIPIDREVNEAPRIRTEGDVTVIPLFEEVVVVQKRFVLKEELHITRTRVSNPFEQAVPLRRLRAKVQRFGPDGREVMDSDGSSGT